MYRHVGVVLAVLTFLIGGYEALALVTPLPTLSRITQGLRDSGHHVLVFIISLIVGAILVWFAQWLYYHFNYQPRSGN